VLYFYPKDNTGGCTREAQDFTTYKDKFKELNAEIAGVSPDTTKSHRNFIEKKELDITLLSDPEKEVLKKYNAWQLKKRSGKEYYGVVRTTFLINSDGKIEHIWRNVSVKDHVEEVFNKLKEFK
jgi:peroxiredoxin Q/BCP